MRGESVEKVWGKSGKRMGKEWRKSGESSGLKGECRDCVKQSINKHVTQTI